MKILWVGWGDLATRAAPLLVGDGHEVVGLRRSPIQDPPDGVTGLQGDLLAPDGFQLPPGVEAFVVTLTPDTRDQAGYETAYLTTMANLQAKVEGEGHASNARPHRLVFASSTAVYGEDDGSWVEEASSPSSTRFNGRVMARAERQVLASEAWQGVVARLGGIYGPGRTRLIRGVEAMAPTSTRWTNRIHSDDAAAALVHLVTAPEQLVPDIVNVVDTAPARKCDVTDFIAAALGVPAPQVDPDDTSRGKRVDGTRLVTTGFRHRHPTHREGYRDVLATLNG